MRDSGRTGHAVKSTGQRPVSVIVPMKNSETTVTRTLRSLHTQKYPIQEIIVIDNASKDGSVECVRRYRKVAKIPIILIARKVNKGVGASFNLGARRAKSELLVLMHSDSDLGSPEELTKLTAPILQNQEVVASYASSVMPFDVWKTFTFWEKRLFTRAVGRTDPGFTGKFDCVRTDAFRTVGGFDDRNFGEDIGIGGEDADLYLRLTRIGTVLLSTATVTHLHYLGTDFGLLRFLATRRLLAKTYGRLIRVRWKELPPTSDGRWDRFHIGTLVLLHRPIIAIMAVLPWLYPFGPLILLGYVLFSSRTMYLHRETRRNPNILLLPIVDTLVLYFELWYMAAAFLKTEKSV